MLCLFSDFSNRFLFIKSFFLKLFKNIYSLFMLFWILSVTVVFTLAMALSFSLSLLKGLGIFSLLGRRLLYLWSDFLLLFYRLKVEGRENVVGSKSYIIFSNHQSNLDIPVLTSIFRFPCVWFARDDLFSIPVFSWVLRKLSYIPVLRGDAICSFSSFRRALRSLSSFSGSSLVIFPEGKWSPYPYKLLPFKRGLYYLALHTGLPLLPVTVIGSHFANPPDTLRLSPSNIKVVIHSPVFIEDYRDNDELSFLRSMEEIVEAPLKEEEALS